MKSFLSEMKDKAITWATNPKTILPYLGSVLMMFGSGSMWSQNGWKGAGMSMTVVVGQVVYVFAKNAFSHFAKKEVDRLT